MKSYTLTRVPRADLVAIAIGALLVLLARLGVPSEALDHLDRDAIAKELVTAFGALMACAAAIRAAYYKQKIEDPEVVGDG